VVRCELHRTNIDLEGVFQEILKQSSQIGQKNDSRGEHTEARRCTSFGQVAENMSVCRSGRIWPIILRI
jgi:hypothetical protein